MSKTEGRLLLDTHMWVWLALGSEQFPKGTVRKRVDKAFHEGRLAISSISMWEVAMLEAKGRIRFSSPCLDWIKTSAGLLRLEILPISPEIAVESTRLPGGFHGDPADRLIVSTARVENCILLTQDELIKEYTSNGLVRGISD